MQMFDTKIQQKPNIKKKNQVFFSTPVYKIVGKGWIIHLFRTKTTIKTSQLIIIRTLKIKNNRLLSILLYYRIQQKGHRMARHTHFAITREEKRDPLVTYHKQSSTYNFLII